MTAPFQVLIYGSALIGLLVLLGAAWMFIRRRFREPTDPQADGFRIEDLERLVRQGTISQEEFDRLRRLAMGMPPAAKPLTPPRANDDDKQGHEGQC